MSKAVELKIQRLLTQLDDFERVADELLRDWDVHAPAKEELEAIAFFLINCGFVPSLLDRVSQQIKEEKPIFWPVYRLLLEGAPDLFDEKVANAVVTGVKEERFPPILVYSPALAKYNSEFDGCIADYFQKSQENFEDRVKDFLDRVQFLKSQRLFDEEKRALENLSLLAPSLAATRELWDDYHDRWALHILTLRQSVEQTSRLTQKIQSQWREQMLPCFSVIYSQLETLAKSDPEFSLDLALLAYFMDFTEQAQKIAETAPESKARDWLLAELLLENRRFVDLLEWVHKLETRYADDTDVAFAASYLKAKAFWGLGQRTTAVDLLNSILKIRPNYRSAHSLLQEWQRGGS